MNKEKICGYMVVRLPAENFDKDGRGIFQKEAPQKNGCFYAGIDRMAWFDLDELFFIDNKSNNATNLRNKLKDINADFSGIDILPSLALAQEVFELIEKYRGGNEIIAIYSDMLINLKGVRPLEGEYHFLGLDIITMDGSSLLREGIYGGTSFDQSWASALNMHGLFDTNILWKDFASKYREWAVVAFDETIEVSTIGSVKVFRLKT